MELPPCNFSIFALTQNILLRLNISKKDIISRSFIYPLLISSKKSYPALLLGITAVVVLKLVKLGLFHISKNIFLFSSTVLSDNIENLKARILNMRVVDDWRSSSRLNGHLVHKQGFWFNIENWYWILKSWNIEYCILKYWIWK